MVRLLAKIFIKDNKNYTDGKVRTAYGYICGGLGIFFNLVLFTGKFLAGTLSGSVAVTADAFNNLSDAGSSFISLIGFRLAAQKPDPGHPFGHGRFEYIASLIISIIIIIMGFELGRDSVLKILSPEAVEYSTLTFIVLGISICVKLYMFFYNTATGKKIDSSTMRATALDSISDTIATFAVLVSAIISASTGIVIDGWMGLAVAVFIFITGATSAKDTIDSLLGTPPSEDFVKMICDIVMSHEGIIGIHDMIVHNYGPGRTFISLHAEIPSDCDILSAHDEIDNIEREITEKTGCFVTIHMDPIDVRDELTNETKQEVREIIDVISPAISFHDFRMVSGPTHTNVIFDIVVPHDYKYSDEELVKIISEKIHEENENYYAVINVDKDFISHGTE